MTAPAPRRRTGAENQVRDDEALQVAQEALDVARATSSKVDQILTLLGQEQEDGAGGYVATGLLGRLRRVEASALKLVKTYEGWFKFFAGFGVAFAMLATVIWFLAKDAITGLFHP